MKCQKCGYEVDASMKFCPICGSEVTYVQQNPVVKKCSNCGTEIEEGIRFCPNCGQRTEQIQENMWKPQAAVDQVQKSESVMNTAQGSVQNAAMGNSGQDNAYMAQTGDLPIENVEETGQTLLFERDRWYGGRSRQSETIVVISDTDIKIKKSYIKFRWKEEEKVFAKSEVVFASMRTAMDVREMLYAGFEMGIGFFCMMGAIISVDGGEWFIAAVVGFLSGAWSFWDAYGQAIDIKSVRGETYSILFDGGKHKQEAQFLLNICNRPKMPQA